MATVRTPIPGIFYRRPSPDADAYVDEGDQVSSGQVIGLVEVMKTFNELKADTDGVLVRFLVADTDELTVGQDVAEVESG